jgi:hypothetical protein
MKYLKMLGLAVVTAMALIDDRARDHRLTEKPFPAAPEAALPGGSLPQCRIFDLQLLTNH